MNADVLIIAGEASSDVYAAQVVRDLRTLNSNATFYGVGGKHLENAGMEIVVPSSAISVMGFSEWLGRVGEVVGAYRKVVKTIRTRVPDVAVLLDLPDFNLRIAAILHELGVPVVYFISPQVWAWRKSRIQTIRRLVTKMLVIFPFEEKIYSEKGVDAEFVGHPLLEQISARLSHRAHTEIQSAPRIAVLPGSRPSELTRHLPVVTEVCRLVREAYPEAHFRTPVAPTVVGHSAFKAYAQSGCEVVEDRAEEVLKWADVALVASGTATLEAALVGTPLVAFYRVAKLTEALFRLMTPYRDFIALPNVILKRTVCPEYIQQNCQPKEIALSLRQLLFNLQIREHQQKALADLRTHLESTQLGIRPSEMVAKCVNTYLKQKNLLDGRRLLIEPTFA